MMAAGERTLRRPTTMTEAEEAVQEQIPTGRFVVGALFFVLGLSVLAALGILYRAAR